MLSSVYVQSEHPSGDVKTEDVKTEPIIMSCEKYLNFSNFLLEKVRHGDFLGDKLSGTLGSEIVYNMNHNLMTPRHFFRKENC